MKLKKVWMLLVLGLALALFAGCAQEAPKKEEKKETEEVKSEDKKDEVKPEDKKEEDKKEATDMHIEVVAKGFQHQFWKAVKQGAEEAAKKYGVTMEFTGPPNETAIQEQVQQFSNALNKKPAAVCLAALDTKASMDLLNQAKAQNIPIIGFDSGVPDAPEGTVLANAATDNTNAAKLAAEHHFEALKGKIEAATAEKPVRIGIVSQEANSQSITDRTQGYIDKMSELAGALDNVKDKIAVVGHDKFNKGVAENEAVVVIELRIPAQVNDADGQTQAQTLLNKEDLIGIYGSNEFGAKSIVNADNAVGGKIGEGKIIAVGFDSGEIQLDAIKNKKLLGSVTQDPVQIGFQAVELAVKAAKGEAVADVDTGARWYDSTNMDAPEIAPLLYK